MKRKGKFLSLESDAQTIEQPIQGSPYITPTADLLSKARAQIEADRRADMQIPADGSIPASRISQENGTGIGSDLLRIPELEASFPKAPQQTDVKDDGNNVGDPAKTGDAPSNLPVTTGSQHGTAIHGNAYPANTTSTEALSPEDMAAVTQIAATAVQTALASGQYGMVNTPNAAQAADDAAQSVATSAAGTTPAGPNAGPAGATPAEAARVVADLIKSNPDTVVEIARAIDTVADAAMAATGEKPTEIAAAAENKVAGGPPTDTDMDDEDEAAEEELDELEEERDDVEEDIEEVEDVEDELEVATESLVSRIRLVTALESAVEASLQNGGLSEDAANILQTVTDNISDDDVDELDLGLESFSYRDRELATHHIKNQLRYSRESLMDDLKSLAGKFIDLFRTFARSTEVWLTTTRRSVELTRSMLVGKVDPLELPVPSGTSFDEATERTHGQLTYMVTDYYTYLHEASTAITNALQKIDTGLKAVEQPELAKRVATMRVKAPAIMKPNPGGAGCVTEGMVSGRRIEVLFNGMGSYDRIVKVPEMTRVPATPLDMMSAFDGLSNLMLNIEDYIRSEINTMSNVRDVQGCLGLYDYAMRVWGPSMIGTPGTTQHAVEFNGKLITFSEYVVYLVTEYHTALNTIRDAVTVTRNYADYLLSNAKRFK